MIRTIMFLLLLPCLPSVSGQDTSLTKEFESLSAKERSRIAKQEAEESVKDVAFQEVMAEAEDLFRSKRYDDALERYIQARRMRPYNVYPKVKIQDLEALIAKRNAEEETERAGPGTDVQATGTPVAVPVEVAPPKGTPQPPVAIPVDEPKVDKAIAEPLASPPNGAAPTPVQEQVDPKSAPPPRIVKASSPVPVVTGSPDGQRTEGVEVILHPPVIDGVRERMYRDGRAVVLERQVTTQGQTTVYKRVTHPYGEAVHFKDGVAITDRIWNEVFGD